MRVCKCCIVLKCKTGELHSLEVHDSALAHTRAVAMCCQGALAHAHKHLRPALTVELATTRTRTNRHAQARTAMNATPCK
eukprot:258813-Alexandrium_andersonii.AAC.2